MIVQPNFLDHWKTRLLQSELSDDPNAPLYVLRLWGHCQEQKTHRFPGMSAGSLAAICCYKSSPEQLWLAMQSARFIVVKNQTLEVHQWDKYNAGLITSWKNGRKGGRPSKPTGYPRDTHGQPETNPLKTDREDSIDGINKSLIDTTPLPPSEKGEQSSDHLPFTSPDFLSAWSDFEQHRREIHKPLKPTSRKMALKELATMGEHRAIAALRHTIAKGWQGIREPEGSMTSKRGWQ